VFTHFPTKDNRRLKKNLIMCYYYLNRHPCICLDEKRVLAQPCRRASFRLCPESSPLPIIKPCDVVENAWGRRTLACQKCRSFLESMAGETVSKKANETNDFDILSMSNPQSFSPHNRAIFSWARGRPRIGQIEGQISQADIPVHTTYLDSEPEQSRAPCGPHLNEETGEILLSEEVVSVIPPQTDSPAVKRRRQRRLNKASKLSPAYQNSSSNVLLQIPDQSRARQTPSKRTPTTKAPAATQDRTQPYSNSKVGVVSFTQVPKRQRRLRSSRRQATRRTANQELAENLLDISTNAHVLPMAPALDATMVPGNNTSSQDFGQLTSPISFINLDFSQFQGSNSEINHLNFMDMVNSASSEINPASFVTGSIDCSPNWTETSYFANHEADSNDYLANTSVVTLNSVPQPAPVASPVEHLFDG
jgi:hypothetical protein